MIKQKTLYREGDQGYMYIDSAGYFKVCIRPVYCISCKLEDG